MISKLKEKFVEFGPIFQMPMLLAGLVYALFLPETLYYALGIYFDLWFKTLNSFWGYPILFVLIASPFLNIGLALLLLFQSFHVLFKIIFTSYDPSFHGFITTYPAVVISLVLIMMVLSKK